VRIARLVLWVTVITLLAAGALAYSCAPAASAAAKPLPNGHDWTVTGTHVKAAALTSGAGGRTPTEPTAFRRATQ
jgi:hypothetical protein